MEFNQEDQKWIIAARKDLIPNQIAKILKVNVDDVNSFLDSVTYSIYMDKGSFEKLKKVITKEFIIRKINEDETQESLAKKLNIRTLTLKRALKENKLDWNYLKENNKKDKDVNLTHKKCSKCCQTLDVKLFYKDDRTKSKLSSWCKNCKSTKLAIS